MSTHPTYRLIVTYRWTEEKNQTGQIIAHSLAEATNLTAILAARGDVLAIDVKRNNDNPN